MDIVDCASSGCHPQIRYLGHNHAWPRAHLGRKIASATKLSSHSMFLDLYSTSSCTIPVRYISQDISWQSPNRSHQASHHLRSRNTMIASPFPRHIAITPRPRPKLSTTTPPKHSPSSQLCRDTNSRISRSRIWLSITLPNRQSAPIPPPSSTRR